MFDNYVDSADVAWTVKTRREVLAAIRDGQPLDGFMDIEKFQQFAKHQSKKEAGFSELSIEDQLTRWQNALKQSLPVFIFGVRQFDPAQRMQKNIAELSGLFMFDADHLDIDPQEAFRRTQVEGFPWEICLAHKTSSGDGLRLVCEARPELGNIADNQICLGRELGLMDFTDESCKDAARVSFCPSREDIYFIDDNQLFNF